MKLKLFYRLVIRQKIAWILNVLCLSVAFAVLFIVIKQVKYDFSFDTCYPKAENVYQLGYYNVITDKHESTMPIPLIRLALESTPEVMAYTILWSSTIEKTSFYNGDTEYQNVPFYGVYPGFMKVFQPRIIAGDANEALENKSGLVLPRSVAEKWFGQENPVGKTLGYGRKNNPWLIKAVYEDFPENSSIRNAIILKMNENNDWDWSYYAFFRATDGTDREQLEKKIIQTVDSIALAKNSAGGIFSQKRTLEVRHMQDIYFSQDLFKPHVNFAVSLCLLAIGILIIAVAYINFVNFSTALAPTRIGIFNVCKISGATEAVLRRGIVGEAVFLSLLAWGVAFFWVTAFSGTALAKAYFKTSLDPMDSLGLLGVLGLGALLLGLLTGLYPAFYTTSFQPALVLKGSFAMSGSGRRLRNVLLLFQFIVTIVLVITSLFVVLQHRYIRNLPMGFQRENIVYTYSNNKIATSRETFRSELMKNPHVLDVTSSWYIPGNLKQRWSLNIDTLYMEFYLWPIADNFLSFFGIPVYEGDTLREPPINTDYLIFNRKMVEKFGLQGTIGKELNKVFYNKGILLGFAENVNFASLHNEIEPMAFIAGKDIGMGYVFIKIRSEKIPETIQYLKNCFAKYEKEDAEFIFLDDYINSLYKQEENLSHLIILFCLITVIISLAGIYGLILFNIRYKVKEISIRKIHGATSKQILWKLNRIFIRLVVAGFIFAVPLAYMIVNGWLSGYPYRTPIYWWVFMLACLITLLITLATVSWQSWKAANANPVDAVKIE